VLDDKRYNEIIVTRATVPVGEDIGFLPGTEEEKMQPWMGAFDDNLEVLQKTDDAAGEWGRAATQELIRSRIKVKSMNFMRGRTFVDKYLIIDEAQNLTPKQMKTLVTRAGPGTKIVCLGNIAQIDTPYLTEGSSGLTYVVDRFKGWGHSGHVTLARGERSRLADHARTSCNAIRPTFCRLDLLRRSGSERRFYFRVESIRAPASRNATYARNLVNSHEWLREARGTVYHRVCLSSYDSRAARSSPCHASNLGSRRRRLTARGLPSVPPQSARAARA
jgi:hypothetical protein